MENIQYLFEKPLYQPSFLGFSVGLLMALCHVVGIAALVRDGFMRKISWTASAFWVLCLMFTGYQSVKFTAQYDRSNWVGPKYEVVTGVLDKDSVYLSINGDIKCGRYTLEDGSGRSVDPCLSSYQFSKEPYPFNNIFLYKVKSEDLKKIRMYPWSGT